MTDLENHLKRFVNAADGPNHYERLQDYFRQCVEFSRLRGASVLEVGAGPGYLSALCLAKGAARVVALDPEADGATAGIHEQFGRLCESVPQIAAIKYLCVGLEEYATTCGEQGFDFILMRSVINHLDEAAVQKLHLRDADEARNRYVKLFRMTHGLLNEAGVLLASDVGRYNLWNSLGLVFPGSRSIEWHKHQDPPVWEELLRRAGFAEVEVKWFSPFRLRHLRPVVAHRPIVQRLNSHFLIRARS
jgi:SAM-dependent methyltransferase